MIDQDKPLSDWTLGEAREECNKHEGNCGGCPFYRRKKGCRLYSEYDATYWNLEEKPRFTQDEVADAKTVWRMFPKVAIISRGCEGPLILGDKDRVVQFVLQPNTKVFHSIRPGQSVRLEDVLGANS